ncbi:MAG: rhodanese-like domain-containing protein [Bacteroidetes bacterium]|nr:rhodanese-like domain-containing protein [Bacteroidota bacterium]
MPHKHIDSHSFKEKMQNQEYVIIDVRTSEEHNTKKIAHSLQLDFYAPDFQSQIEKLDKDKVYLVYCRSGNRSGQAMDMMKNMGFEEVYNLDGGIIGWEANNLEFVK